ncbi:hypothetical protein [Paraburkholderia sp. HP33-1]|uniref:hypothetical protein n=1 Tax=Paraburkholderia sp. HP33-1 TaxID=2883243 RepID=UPI001F459379|nr:hypothetical protein [Paraburkholderia sp. HP33-1]
MPDADERKQITNYVARQLSAENRWTKLWSLLYHGFVFGAAILSAAAALILQLKSISIEPTSRTDLATALAAISSLLAVISASGGFAAKWRANRITKGTLEQIQIDLMDPACDLADIREQLKRMKQVHNLAIVGEAEKARTTGRR